MDPSSCKYGKVDFAQVPRANTAPTPSNAHRAVLATYWIVGHVCSSAAIMSSQHRATALNVTIHVCSASNKHRAPSAAVSWSAGNASPNVLPTTTKRTESVSTTRPSQRSIARHKYTRSTIAQASTALSKLWFAVIACVMSVGMTHCTATSVSPAWWVSTVNASRTALSASSSTGRRATCATRHVSNA